MASTFSDLLKIELIGDGEQSGSWGTTTNNNLSQSIEHSIAGVLGVNTSSSTAVTLTTGNGPQAQADNQARQASLIFSGASANCVVTVPATQKIYNVHNTNTSYTITLRLSGTSTDYVIPASSSALVSTTGAAWHALAPGSFTAGGTISNTSGDITIDAVADINLDAGDGTVFLKDDGTIFGALQNSSTNLQLKSGSSNTVAATFSGANVTFAGTLASGAITSSGDVTAFSDMRIKHDIETIEGALDKVSDMRGVYFKRNNGEAGTGVIAQEIENILPEVVKDGEYKSVAYGNMVGILIEAIKELKAEVEKLKESK